MLGEFLSSAVAPSDALQTDGTNMAVTQKLIQLALVNLVWDDKTTTNDKWLTLDAIHKLVYTRFNFDDDIDFNINQLNKAVKKCRPMKA
jgi:hypothetical protein